MIQLNLLPDVKIEYIKTQRTKRFALLASTLVIAVSIGLLVVVYGFVAGVQKRHISNLGKDIDEGISTIQNTPGVNEILTVQNQLGVVNGKHDEKPATVRVLPFIAQLFPEGAKASQISASFSDYRLILTGTTTDINSTNKFVDTLKFAKYKAVKKDEAGKVTDEEPIEGKAFSEVVLGTYTTEPGASDFSVTMKFDPVIFDNDYEVEILVPGIISTRSSTEKPVIEFNQKPVPAEGN